MPFIQETYRIERGSGRTGIGGSSLGGLVSLYLGLRMPEIFGKNRRAIAVVWWNHRVILRFAQASMPEPRPRIWLDIGTREGPRIVDDVEMLRDALMQKAGASARICITSEWKAPNTTKPHGRSVSVRSLSFCFLPADCSVYCAPRRICIKRSAGPRWRRTQWLSGPSRFLRKLIRKGPGISAHVASASAAACFCSLWKNSATETGRAKPSTRCSSCPKTSRFPV